MTPETCRESRSFVPNMAKWGSTCYHNYLYRWLPCQYFILLMMGAWRPKHVEKFCSNKICILLHHVGVLFNLVYFFVLLLSSESILITRNKLKEINCTLKGKYIIHSKETVKSLAYLALFRETEVLIVVKRHVKNIRSLKIGVSAFLLRLVLLAPSCAINTKAPLPGTRFFILTFLLILLL